MHVSNDENHDALDVYPVSRFSLREKEKHRNSHENIVNIFKTGFATF